MSGLNIKEMEASETLDVIHFFFEEDLFVASAEEMESKSSVRVSIYKSLYAEQYKYEYKAPKSNGSSGVGSYRSEDFYDEDLVPFDPSAPPKPTKNYVPPTDFNEESSLPFGELLDAPLQ